jgi:hypothetical protein
VAWRRTPQASGAVSRILGTVLGPVFLMMAAAAAPAPVVEAVAPPAVVARLPRPVLALAFAAPGRGLLLEDDRISRWKLTADGLARQAEQPAPAPNERTRRPGGVIRASAGAPDFWVLRSGWPEALLFAYEEGAHGITWIAKGGALALPWPEATNGLRFRPGTNVLEGVVEGLPGTSFLALSADGALGVDAEGVLHHPDGGPALRVGSAVARPWTDVALATAPVFGPVDSLLAIPLPLSPGAVAKTVASVDGAIQALATFVEKDSAVVLVGVRATDATYQVLRIDLRRRTAP